MRSGSLWRQRDFRLLWIGQAISETGSVVARTALPIAAILVLDAGALEVGLLVAAAALAGPVARRFCIGPAIVWCEIGSALLYLLIPLAGGPPLLAALFLFIPQLVGDGIALLRTRDVPVNA